VVGFCPAGGSRSAVNFTVDAVAVQLCTAQSAAQVSQVSPASSTPLPHRAPPPGVGVPVGVKVGLETPPVAVGVALAVGLSGAVMVGVLDAVAVAVRLDAVVGVAVLRAVPVRVAGAVPVGAGVAALVGLLVKVAMAVGVRVGTADGVRVLVAVPVAGGTLVTVGIGVCVLGGAPVLVGRGVLVPTAVALRGGVTPSRGVGVFDRAVAVAPRAGVAVAGKTTETAASLPQAERTMAQATTAIQAPTWSRWRMRTSLVSPVWHRWGEGDGMSARHCVGPLTSQVQPSMGPFAALQPTTTQDRSSIVGGGAS
jgi:hypothetical protein